MPNYNSPALDKGLDILEYLSLNSTPQSQTEIAIGSDRKPNEIYRMLICLEERGYIMRNKISGKFSLSLKLYHLSHQHSSVNSIKEAALYPMQALSEFSKQSCHLSILYKNKVLIIAQSLSTGPISLSIQDGSLFPLYKTTSGRVILSQLMEKERLIYLKKDQHFNQLSEKQGKIYLTEVNSISKSGSIIINSETTHGVTDIAIPFGVKKINIVGSLTVTILSSQISETVTLQKILSKSKETVENIYKNMGIN